MSLTDAWIEHVEASTLGPDDSDVDLGVVPGQFNCFTDDEDGWAQPHRVTFEEALAWFIRIGMPPRLKLSAVDQARLHRIGVWSTGRIGFWLRCNSCERATTTGLCGCEDPDPVKIGEFIAAGTLRG